MPAPCARRDLQAQHSGDLSGPRAIAQVGLGDGTAALRSRNRSVAASAAACRSDNRRYGGVNDTTCSPNGGPAADDVAHDLRQHRLGQCDQVLVVHVGLVELQHRELGVVLGRDAFVTEVTIDLVHTFKTAHDEPFQVQLRRHAQVQVDDPGCCGA